MPPEVPGASIDERKLLGALGGVAAAIGGVHVAGWSAELRDWALAAPHPPRPLIDAVDNALQRRLDPLAVLYDASISAKNRRRLGTVFTPKPLVDHMVGLVEGELGKASPSVVLDPGAGVGAFTIAAARRWPSAQIVAIDVNVVTLGLLAARVAFEIDAHPEEQAVLSRVSLVLGDYLDHFPSTFDDRRSEPIVVLGNPPYTRVQELAFEVRTKARQLSEGVIDSGHANLAMLFQAATFSVMRPQDISCLVVPGSITYTRASRGLRTRLWNSHRAIVVERTPASTRAFVGRDVQAAVVLVGAERERRPPLRLSRVEVGDISVDRIETWAVSRQETQPDNWFFTGSNSGSADALTPLPTIAASRRGVATGANQMFFLDDATAKALPADVVVPAISTLREFDGEVLDHDSHAAMSVVRARRWLLAIPPDYELREALARYVADFEDEVGGRHLVNQRSPWYAIPDLYRPQILLSPLASSGFKVVINEIAAVPSNNLFGLVLRDGADPARLAAWLRSKDGQDELLRCSRRYHGGSHKLEPGDLKRVLVPRSVLDLS